jgi:hypothetical protein
MDRRTFLMAAAAAALPGCVAVGGTDGPPAQAPVYRVGDRWIYSAQDGFRAPVTWDETHEVIAVNAQGITVRITQKGPTVDNTRTEQWPSPGIVTVGALFDNETRQFKTPLTRFQFPLSPRATWNQRIDNFNESTQQAGQISRFVQVGGWVKVQVPAGEFDAILMRVIMRLDDETFWRFATECNYEIWWSPAVGASVRESKIATYLARPAQRRRARLFLCVAQRRTQRRTQPLAHRVRPLDGFVRRAVITHRVGLALLRRVAERNEFALDVGGARLVVRLEIKDVLDDDRHDQSVNIETMAAEHRARARAPGRAHQLEDVRNEIGRVGHAADSTPSRRVKAPGDAR